MNIDCGVLNIEFNFFFFNYNKIRFDFFTNVFNFMLNNTMKFCILYLNESNRYLND
jgi:hypothetical protein